MTLALILTLTLVLALTPTPTLTLTLTRQELVTVYERRSIVAKHVSTVKVRINEP